MRRAVRAGATPGDVVVALDPPLRLAAGSYALAATPAIGGSLAWSTCPGGSGALLPDGRPALDRARRRHRLRLRGRDAGAGPATARDDDRRGARPAARPPTRSRFRFGASEPATSTCAVDRAAPRLHVPVVLAGLADGPHAVVVASTDRAGNAETAPPRVAFVVDRTPPSRRRATAGRAGVHAAAYTIATDDPTAALTCALDAGAAAPCTGTGGLDPAARARTSCTSGAQDAAGNARTADAAFTADWTPPTLTLPAPPVVAASDARGATVPFGASATDALDPAPVVTCDPRAGSRFAIGATRVTCRAADANGNAATGAFTVTVTGPPLPELRLAYDPASGRIRATEAGGGTVAVHGAEVVARRAGHVLRARVETRRGLVALRRLCYDRTPCSRPADNRYAVVALRRHGRLQRLVAIAVAGPRTIVARYVAARDVTIVTTFDRALGGRGVSAGVRHGLALPVLQSAGGAVAVAVP